MRRRVFLGPLPGLLLGTGASAQDLTAYRTLAYTLDRAAAQVGSDRAAAQSALDRAQSALTDLAPTLPGGEQGALARNLLATVTQARSALGRTPAEVQANVMLARGLLRRALYDQALSSLQPRPSAANDTAALRLLGRELGLEGEALASLSLQARLGERSAVQWRAQRVAASRVLSALQNTGPGQPRTVNYLSLTRAASWFALVREPGRQTTPPLGVPQFDQALRQVSGAQTGLDQTELAQTELAQTLSSLQAGAADLNRRLGLKPPVKAASSAPSVQPVPTETASPTETAASAVTQPPPAPSPSVPSVLAQPTRTLDAVYAALARALSACGRGDPAQARATLTQVTPLLAELPAALRAAPALAQFGRDVQSMQRRTGLRPDDVQALIATLGRAEREAAGQATAGAEGFAAGVSRFLGGGVRALLELALAALCLPALFLLNLAFGGSNVYWRSIWAGLLTLTLPLLLSGVFGALGWLGDLLDLPLLRGAVNLTLSQGALSQGAGGGLLRGLLSAAGLGLLAYGFQGLCRQFGLLGRRAAPRSAPRSPSRYTQHDLDWDEEA